MSPSQKDTLLSALSRYAGVRFVLISPEELRLPGYLISDVIEKNGIPYVETRHLDEVLPDLDILYMTRVQKERFFNEADYLRLKDSYILTSDKLKAAKPTLSVMHPLPRVNEIAQGSTTIPAPAISGRRRTANTSGRR